MPEDRRAEAFDEWKWLGELYEVKQRRSAADSKAVVDLRKRFNTIKGWLFELDLFFSPLPRQGFHYPKPRAYLAYRLAETFIPMNQVREKLERLA